MLCFLPLSSSLSRALQTSSSTHFAVMTLLSSSPPGTEDVGFHPFCLSDPFLFSSLRRYDEFQSKQQFHGGRVQALVRSHVSSTEWWQCQLHGVELVQQVTTAQFNRNKAMVSPMAQQMQQFNQCNSTVQQMHCYNASAPMQSRQFHGGVDCFTKQLALDTGGHRSDPRAVTNRGLRCSNLPVLLLFAFPIYPTASAF